VSYSNNPRIILSRSPLVHHLSLSGERWTDYQQIRLFDFVELRLNRTSLPSHIDRIAFAA
jgi:hypothetical protein